MQLFRYPADLMQVGRPIADLMRHNARCACWPWPSGRTIERRLAHLRSGNPHLHESAKEDGTVLEIRGKPAAEGGFVTSYADITSYKNAARANCARWPMRWSSVWRTAPATWTRPGARPKARQPLQAPAGGRRRARPVAA